MKYIAIKVTKCVLYLTEQELTSLLAKDRELWTTAIKRGKAFTRAKESQQRGVKK
ncbi:hypothetical protein JCM14036_02910 [Desulfotomaculum defluvii]